MVDLKRFVLHNWTMSDVHSRLEDLGAAIPEILLPKKGIDLSKWAVVACDQYTQDMNYWAEVKKTAGNAPSSYNLIFPEAYLLEKEGDSAKNLRVQQIKSSMNSYIYEDIFAPKRHCSVYLERSTSHNPIRRGLMLAIDLERYDWAREARPLIRSTEGTMQERLPPRMAVRRGAPLELPHILLLIDDEDDDLIPSLGAIARKQPPLYDTPLMMKGGSVAGWALDTEDSWTLLADGLEKLAKKAGKKYGSASGECPFLFAVGDGNHSLAAAKAVWEEYKTNHAAEPGLENHPARWALVELENLYDPGIKFEPIHRVIFGVQPPELLEALSSLKDIKCSQDKQDSRVIRIENLSSNIATVSLQPLLDSFVKEKNSSIDYIHGEDEVFRLAGDSSRQVVGLILPPVKKDGLFKTIAQNGPLPRKSFSMGEAEEKRFYLECRRLFY